MLSFHHHGWSYTSSLIAAQLEKAILDFQPTHSSGGKKTQTKHKKQPVDQNGRTGLNAWRYRYVLY